ncbi:hypothetical protein MTR67_010030 [Solanum verrucosum]|uniref:Uncharacterized protein n=1 Tax=Solanum verrucosum TaxID=315347 RepID=A0AAF0TKP7_SOLVR|nr:hypothetical protein MTR67_010030 [Solanum verrucosum]
MRMVSLMMFQKDILLFMLEKIEVDI